MEESKGGGRIKNELLSILISQSEGLKRTLLKGYLTLKYTVFTLC